MESEFQTIFPRCAFLDVHQESVEATVRIQEGERVRQQIQRWGTMTADIEALADWLTAQG